jgi:predicted RNA-binding protein with RPS1 domain
MNAKMQKAVNDILKATISQLGMGGHWRLNSIQRFADFQREMPVFAAKALVEVKGGKQNSGIKVIIKALRDRKSCFEAILVPPDEHDAVDVLQALVGGPGEGKSGGIPEVREAKQDAIYIGRVASLTNYGAFVTIFPDNPPRMQEALVHITEISHSFLNKPEQELRRGQMVRVVCTGFNDDGKVKLSRKQLLPVKDEFKPKPINGELSMHAFTMSEERVAIALNIIRESIETHSTKLAWSKVEADGVIGAVFLEGPGYAFAPARLVLADLKEGILRQWKAKTSSTMGGLIRHLVGKGYICSSTDAEGENSVGYCMMEEGYNFLCAEAPPLPEYYDPPDVRKSERSLPVKEENAPIAMATPPTTALDLSQVDGMLDQIDEYKKKQERLDEINKALREYDDLVAERQSISDWLEENSEVPGQAALVDQLLQRLAQRQG